MWRRPPQSVSRCQHCQALLEVQFGRRRAGGLVGQCVHHAVQAQAAQLILHALLTNIVLAWNASRMNDAVERMRKDGIDIDDAWLRRIGRVHFGHINFRGTFRFRIEMYAPALLRPRAASAATAKV